MINILLLGEKIKMQITRKFITLFILLLSTNLSLAIIQKWSCNPENIGNFPSFTTMLKDASYVRQYAEKIVDEQAGKRYEHIVDVWKMEINFYYETDSEDRMIFPEFAGPGGFLSTNNEKNLITRTGFLKDKNNIRYTLTLHPMDDPKTVLKHQRLRQDKWWSLTLTLDDVQNEIKRGTYTNEVELSNCKYTVVDRLPEVYSHDEE